MCPAAAANAPAGLCPSCLLAQGDSTVAASQDPRRRFEPPPLAALAALFPQLEILRLIGAGGMGAVYQARQTALGRFVALKILPAGPVGGGGEAASSERFNREARALARLSHPNIVSVHEFGQAGNLHYFLMEYVDGANLRQLQRAGRLSPREALQVIPQLCDALQYAHDEGVVHRDIKPENVLVDRKGRVKVADFGLAKLLDPDAGSSRLTLEGQVMGTPHYMAPEQVERPLSVDHRADIYSLGVVFYEMLTGGPREIRTAVAQAGSRCPPGRHCVSGLGERSRLSLPARQRGEAGCRDRGLDASGDHGAHSGDSGFTSCPRGASTPLAGHSRGGRTRWRARGFVPGRTRGGLRHDGGGDRGPLVRPLVRGRRACLAEPQPGRRPLHSVLGDPLHPQTGGAHTRRQQEVSVCVFGRFDACHAGRGDHRGTFRKGPMGGHPADTFERGQGAGEGRPGAADPPANSAAAKTPTPMEPPPVPSDEPAVYVEGGGSHPTIQAALDAAPPGATVRVSKGRWAETLLVLKPVRLVGAGWQQTVIDPGKPLGRPPPEEARALQARFQAAQTNDEREALRREAEERYEPPVLRVRAEGSGEVVLTGLRFTRPAQPPMAPC